MRNKLYNIYTSWFFFQHRQDKYKMATLPSILLPTIILYIGLNILPAINGIKVVPVWNATVTQNDSWPCFLGYDGDVDTQDVISFHGDPGEICSVQVVSSPKSATVIQLPSGTYPGTFLFAEGHGDIQSCQNRYIAVTGAGPCMIVFHHPNMHLSLEGDLTILLTETLKSNYMTTCSTGESIEGDNVTEENQMEQCSTQDFNDTISCSLDQNQICSFNFPSACSSIIEDRSVEFRCNRKHSNQRFLVIYPTDILTLEFKQQNIQQIIGSPFSNLVGLKQLILEYNQLSFIPSSAFSDLNALTYMSVRGNNLVALNITLFQNLKKLVYLDLSNNSLRSFHSEIFVNLVNLNHLNLSSNNFVDIPNAAFSYLSSLSLLDLSNNGMEKLPTNILENLQNLNELYLYDNKLLSLERDTFNETTKLLLLDLWNNNLNNLPKTIISRLHNLQELYLGKNSLSLDSTLFKGTPNLLVLLLGAMDLQKIEAKLFWDLKSLEGLDLGHNKLKQLDNSHLRRLINLKVLFLNKNELEILGIHLFSNTVKLRVIHLAENKLTSIPDLNDLKFLEYLNLQDNSLIMIDKNSFNNLPEHTEIVVSQPEICECYVSAEINCSSLNFRSPYLTCDRLLSDRTLVVIMWLIGLNALCGNMFVLMWRKKTKDKSKVQTFLLSNLAMSDFLMGIYMLLLASADIHFGEYFPMQAEKWRKGTTCRVGTISIVSSEASVFFVTLISIDRLINIRFPFFRHKLSRKSSALIVTLLWLTALTLGLVPSILAGKSYKFYDNSHVCIGLPLAKLQLYSNTFSKDSIGLDELNANYFEIRVQSVPLGEVEGMFFSSGIFLGLNFICYLVILLCYLEIIRTVMKSKKRVGLSPEVKQQVKTTLKVAAIVLTDFSCWFPVIILGVCVQAGVLTLPPSVFAWCVTVVLPINSAINPYLYTIANVIANYREKRESHKSSDPAVPMLAQLREASQSENRTQEQTTQQESVS